MLSRKVEGAKKGGQELLGAMPITIARNGYGSQVPF
jgi:5'-phosphate synthase pdxT subunit